MLDTRVSRSSPQSRLCPFSPPKTCFSGKSGNQRINKCVDRNCVVQNGYFRDILPCFGRGQTRGRRCKNNISGQKKGKNRHKKMNFQIFFKIGKIEKSSGGNSELWMARLPPRAHTWFAMEGLGPLTSLARVSLPRGFWTLFFYGNWSSRSSFPVFKFT